MITIRITIHIGKLDSRSVCVDSTVVPGNAGSKVAGVNVYVRNFVSILGFGHIIGNDKHCFDFIISSTLIMTGLLS